MSPQWLWEIWWPSKVISHHQRGETGRVKKKKVERCRDRMSCAATYTCGFTSTQKQCVSRSMKGRAFKWHTHTLTHKQQFSPRCVFEMYQTGGWFVRRRRERRDSSQIRSTPLTSPSTASAERHLFTYLSKLFYRRLKLSVQFEHFFSIYFISIK